MTIRLLIFSLALWPLLNSCSSAGSDEKNALHSSHRTDSLIQLMLQAHGSHIVGQSSISFDFRGRSYRSQRNGGAFQYERQFADSSGAVVRDVLTNNGLFREMDGERQPLTPKDSTAYAGSVNSVIYFALLPYFLQDKAVNAAYAGEAVLKGEPYHKIKVTFAEEGGGEDHEDVYVYWMHQQQHTMDYLAYSYVVNGGGARFREAYNVRSIEGLRIADYHNYKPMLDTRDVMVFDSLFEAGQMELLSEIEIRQITLSK